MVRYFILLWFLGLSGTGYSQLTPQEAAAEIKKGINMGNTLEPPTEGGWNNPPAREIYFDLYRDAGFDMVRIPVRWDMHTGSVAPYRVDPVWMARVEQVVDWALERGLFVIINAHHDNWIKENYSDPAMRARFDSIWSQVALHFSEKSDRLMFEILNEPHGLTKSQNDELHARILSIIRRTNPTRIVVIQGNEWGGSEELIQMAVPEDEYLIGSFHTYDPWPFGLEGHGAFGLSEIRALDAKFASVREWSDQHQIPVLLGEFGCNIDADYNQRMKHYKTYMELIEKYGFIFSVWDDGGDFRVLERPSSRWNEIKDILIHTTLQSPSNPTLVIFQDTLIRFSWTNVVNNHDSLVVERRTSQSLFAPVAVLPADSNRFTDRNVIPDRDYYYRVLARYGNDSMLYSYPVKIYLPDYVEQERGLFLGEPLPVPGTVEAEYFDLGGEGKAYHDMDRLNIAGDFRPDEGVDIYDRLGDGYHIGNAMPGEWIEYTVEVEKEADYLMEIELAALESGGRFQIRIGEATSDTLVSIGSGSWLTTTAVPSLMHLVPGIQVMRFSIIDEPLFNFDRIVFSLPEAATSISGWDPELVVTAMEDRQLNIRIADSQFAGLLNLYDIRGRMLISGKTLIPGEGFTSQSLAPGLYIVQVSDGIHLLSRKVAVH